jgi:uncharacterized membrane protein required for colicin V production
MSLPFNWIDLAFLITIVVLAFNGFRNGFVASLIGLISLPLALAVALLFGARFTALLAANGLSVTPFIAYIVLFVGVVLLVHILTTIVRGVVHRIPVVGFADEVLGAIVGFIEAWLLWLVLLLVLHNVLSTLQNLPGIDAAQFSTWQQLYNDTIAHSLFAQVNSFMITRIPIHLHS